MWLPFAPEIIMATAGCWKSLPKNIRKRPENFHIRIRQLLFTDYFLWWTPATDVPIHRIYHRYSAGNNPGFRWKMPRFAGFCPDY